MRVSDRRACIVFSNFRGERRAQKVPSQKFENQSLFFNFSFGVSLAVHFLSKRLPLCFSRLHSSLRGRAFPSYHQLKACFPQKSTRKKYTPRRVKRQRDLQWRVEEYTGDIQPKALKKFHFDFADSAARICWHAFCKAAPCEFVASISLQDVLNLPRFVVPLARATWSSLSSL